MHHFLPSRIPLRRYRSTHRYQGKGNRVIIGGDHAGYPLKEVIKTHLMDQGIQVYDIGTHDTSKCDYPDIAEAVCEPIVKGVYGIGIYLTYPRQRYLILWYWYWYLYCCQ